MRRIGLAVIRAVSLFFEPLAAGAPQAGRGPRAGVLAPAVPPLLHFEAFRQGLRDLGCAAMADKTLSRYSAV